MMPRRRRCGKEDAAVLRTSFMTSVQGAVGKLMREKGFSRERATVALLQEIACWGAAEEEAVVPSDEKVENAMRRYGLGMDQAMQVVTVSLAMERCLAHRSLSPEQALEDLTLHISQAQIEQRQEQTQLPTTDRSKQTIPSSSWSLPPSRTVTKKSAAVATPNAITSHKKSKAPSSKSTKTKSSRKRSADDQNENKPALGQTEADSNGVGISRQRTNSVSEVVNAKLAGDQRVEDPSSKTSASSKPAPTSTATNLAPTAAVVVLRSKRARGDHTASAVHEDPNCPVATGNSNHKRQRTGIP